MQKIAPNLTDEIKSSADALINLAFDEDLGEGKDITSVALLSKSEMGSAKIVARETGIVCGLSIVPQIVQRFAPEIVADFQLSDGDQVTNGTSCLEISGPAISLLKTEMISLGSRHPMTEMNILKQ